MKFKKRLDTKYLYLIHKDLQGKTLQQLYIEARRQGNFDTGYHFVLFNNGFLEADRNVECVADCTFENNEESIYVLVDSQGKLSDSQRLTLREFLNNYKTLEVKNE